ncbi:hypothetical protein LTR37_011067 [Vermiconidia calcicola]|uniref:Uncharacterized protein n=1 Tax=Vermiconidia calcicola TaxID=1690605 RepID=A0ACC3N346_9PEZI|nr:hypothetical protein LTR37_011067 [Vermiconidia calcicola]
MSVTQAPAASPFDMHRVKLAQNPDFTRDAVKSYGHALRKFNIKPTLPGPFDMVDELVQPEGHRMQKLFGRTPNVSARRLVMQDESGKVGEVWSSELPTKTKKAGRSTNHNIYVPKNSSTDKLMPGAQWQITYGDGSNASGTVVTDDIEIGGVRVKNQAIELAKQMSSDFQQGAGDGLLGLAFVRLPEFLLVLHSTYHTTKSIINTVRPRQVATPVENMITQSAIQPQNEVFTAYLGGFKDKNDPDAGESFYTFGYIDEDVYAPVNTSNGFWQVASSSYSVNGVSQTTSGNTAIIDTGTTLALVDDQTCKNIYAAIPGSQISRNVGGYIYPTRTPKSQLPDVHFDIGGKMFHINTEDLGYADIGNGYTFGGIQSRGDLPFSIYGDTFLKNVYAIFDVGKKRFGCVQRIDPDNGSTKFTHPAPPTSASSMVYPTPTGNANKPPAT